MRRKPHQILLRLLVCLIPVALLIYVLRNTPGVFYETPLMIAAVLSILTVLNITVRAVSATITELLRREE